MYACVWVWVCVRCCHLRVCCSSTGPTCAVPRCVTAALSLFFVLVLPLLLVDCARVRRVTTSATARTAESPPSSLLHAAAARREEVCHAQPAKPRARPAASLLSFFFVDFVCLPRCRRPQAPVRAGDGEARTARTICPLPHFRDGAAVFFPFFLLCFQTHALSLVSCWDFSARGVLGVLVFCGSTLRCYHLAARLVSSSPHPASSLIHCPTLPPCAPPSPQARRLCLNHRFFVCVVLLFSFSLYIIAAYSLRCPIVPALRGFLIGSPPLCTSPLPLLVYLSSHLGSPRVLCLFCFFLPHSRSSACSACLCVRLCCRPVPASSALPLFFLCHRLIHAYTHAQTERRLDRHPRIPPSRRLLSTCCSSFTPPPLPPTTCSRPSLSLSSSTFFLSPAPLVRRTEVLCHALVAACRQPRSLSASECLSSASPWPPHLLRLCARLQDRHAAFSVLAPPAHPATAVASAGAPRSRCGAGSSFPLFLASPRVGSLPWCTRGCLGDAARVRRRPL